MKSGGDLVGGGVRATDDGRGKLLPGAVKGTGALQEVQVGDDGWIIRGVHDDTTWVSGIGDMDLENLSHRGRTANVIHGLTGQGRPTELPGKGMPRTSGYEDGDAGTSYAPACPGHRGHFGGGKPPPPTVPPVRHADTLT